MACADYFEKPRTAESDDAFEKAALLRYED